MGGRGGEIIRSVVQVPSGWFRNENEAVRVLWPWLDQNWIKGPQSCRQLGLAPMQNDSSKYFYRLFYFPRPEKLGFEISKYLRCSIFKTDNRCGCKVKDAEDLPRFGIFSLFWFFSLLWKSTLATKRKQIHATSVQRVKYESKQMWTEIKILTGDLSAKALGFKVSVCTLFYCCSAGFDLCFMKNGNVRRAVNDLWVLTISSP